MPIFKLDKFPYVCRLCLEPTSSRRPMVSLRSGDPTLDGTIGEYITSLTFEISETKSHLVPQQVCFPCLELLRFFAKYQSKLNTVHLLINSLAELKQSNTAPIEDLFEQDGLRLSDLLHDLDLCNEKDATLKDLLDEFETYAIAAIIDKGDKVDTQVVVEDAGQTDDVTETFVGEELGSDQVAELLNEPKKPRRIIRKSASVKQGKLLKCSKCIFKTYNLRTFETHQQMHLEEGSTEFRCVKPGCTEVFQLKNDYYKHCNKMHKDKVCETCGLLFSNEKALTLHQERHRRLFKYVCRYCQRRFNGPYDVGHHIRATHLAEASFQCTTCGMEFKQKHVRDKHKRIHSDVEDYPCPVCGKRFKVLDNLKRHSREVHEGYRLQCQYCSKSYPKLVKLKDHIESVHGVQQRFICDICVKSFPSQKELDTHKACHDNSLPLQCAICLVVFSSDDQMNGHLCITYRDDYICCERDFRQAFTYNKHMLEKHGLKTNVRVKPIPGQLMGAVRAKRKRIESCNKCEAIFPTRTMKRQHMESCTGPETKMAVDNIKEEQNQNSTDPK